VLQTDCSLLTTAYPLAGPLGLLPFDFKLSPSNLAMSFVVERDEASNAIDLEYNFHDSVVAEL
jgi:hypothetical protein